MAPEKTEYMRLYASTGRTSTQDKGPRRQATTDETQLQSAGDATTSITPPQKGRFRGSNEDRVYN
jgi:hypothetical protein